MACIIFCYKLFRGRGLGVGIQGDACLAVGFLFLGRCSYVF